MQPTVPGSQYVDNYQQSPAVPYTRPYNAPPTYQPQPSMPQPAMFIPSPAPQAPVVSPIHFRFAHNFTYSFGFFLAKLDD